MRGNQNHHFLSRTGPLLAVLLILASLSAWAAPNTTTKILFIQGNANRDLSAYKTFLQNTVYPGQTLVFSGDTLADSKAFSTGGQLGVFTPAQLARINDADLIIVTPDIVTSDLASENLNPTFAPVDWNNINVPMIVHNADIVANVDNQNGYTNRQGGWGWGEPYPGDATLNYGPNTTYGDASIPNGAVCVGIGGTYPYNATLYQTDSFYAGVTVLSSTNANASKWVQMFKGAAPVCRMNINHLQTATGGTELAAALYDRYTGNDIVFRLPQGAQFYKPFRKAGSRRIFFGLGARSDTDAVNTFLGSDATKSATADGLTFLKNALTYLYDPAYGRRPVPYAGAANVNLCLPAGQASVNFTVADATYSDGEGGSAGTLAWSIVAFDSRNEGSETIASGANGLTPQFVFTKPGVYAATLKATKPDLDYVVSQRTFTIAAPTAPRVATLNPRDGRMLANLATPVTVTFDQPVAFTGSNLVLTVTGGTPSPATINGTTTDNTTFSFDCSAITLSGTNAPLGFSLDTSTVRNGIGGGTLSFATSTYTWAYVYNSAGARPIVVCSNRGAASDAAYQSLLTNVYGAGTVITFLTSAQYNPTTAPYDWDAGTADILQNASLVILDTSEGSGLPSGSTFSGLNHIQWRTLRAPLLTNDSYFCSNGVMPSNNMSVGRGTTTARGFYADNYMDNPFYENVPMRPDGYVYLFTGGSGGTMITGSSPIGYVTYGSGNNYTATPGGTSLGFWDIGQEASKISMYWPANTAFHSGTTNTAAGRRIVTPVSSQCLTNYWTGGVVTGSTSGGVIGTAGQQLIANEHKYFAQPTGAPTVIWKDMDATVWHKLDHVTVRFDRAITTPGALTIANASGGTIYTTSAAPTTTDNMTFVYTIPMSTWVGTQSQTLRFSIDMAGVTETESGYALPYLGSSATWQSYYDTAKLRMHIGVIERARENYDMVAFANLIKSFYGPSTWVEFLQVSGSFGSATAPWSQVFMNRLDACDMLIIAANQSVAQGATYWTNTLVPSGGVAAWTKPIINGYPKNYAGTTTEAGNWFSATPSGIGSTQNSMQVQPLDATSALFKGVTVTTDVTGANPRITVMNRLPLGLTANYLPYVPVTANSLTITGAIGATSANTNYCFAAYAAPGSTLYTGTGSTIVHAGSRAFNTVTTNVSAVGILSADGETIFRNQLGMMLPSAAAPSLLSVTPADGSQQTAAVTTVVLTFDWPVSGVGALTLNGQTITASAVGSALNRIWTFSIPADQMPNMATAMTASVDLSGTYETGSGLNIPYPSASYSWSFNFDPEKWQGKVVIVSSNVTPVEDHSAYVSFLQNTVYPTSLCPNGVIIEDVPGKYYSASGATTLGSAQLASLGAADVVVVLPFNSTAVSPGLRPSDAVTKQWNTLPKPLILHNPDLLKNQWNQWGWGTQNSTNRVLSLAAPDTGAFGLGFNGSPLADPIMQGVSVTDGKVRYWNSDIGLMGPDNQTGIYNAHGAGLGGLGLVGDGWQSLLIHWPKYSYFGSNTTAWGTDTAIPAERVFLSMGPYNGETNGYGYSDVANFFATAGASDTGAKQALVNTFRMMFNPATDLRNPPHVVVASCSPNADGRSGNLPKITVHFSVPVDGVLASDLTLNPSTTAFPTPWVATSVVPLGTAPATDWQFDGIWTGSTGLTVPLETYINVAFNPMDPGSTTRSHVVDPATSLGVKPAQWSFFLAWQPLPAAVSEKTWTLYE